MPKKSEGGDEARCREVAVACRVSATTVYNHFPADRQEKLRKLGRPKRKK